jgi:tRNA G18 (ribose-2'-O)-methylase SpoU
LPAEVLERCDERASISQLGGGESLNVAMAGTIALYELAREDR